MVALFAMAVLAPLTTASPASADGTETLGPPSLTVASGTDVLAAGVGLREEQPGTIDLEVPEGSTVEQVILYWEGHSSGPETGVDDTIEIDGVSVTGTLIGGPTRFFGFGPNQHWSSTYRADITALGAVDVGPNSISVDGLSFNQANNGAGILVIVDDGGDASSIDLVDGNDLAFQNFAPPLDTTVAQTLSFAPAAVDRVGTVSIFASSVAGQTDPGERPNVILITVDGVVTQFDNILSSNDGDEWDTVILPIDIPAGATELTVQLLSDDPAEPDTGNLPASMAFLAAAADIPAPPKPGIDIEKATNGNDADDANDTDVPEIAPGDPVTWTYVVTNTGGVPYDIADVVVTDDVLGTITNIVDQGDGDNVLAPGEVWTYQATQAAADDLDAPGISVPVVPGCNPDQVSVPGDRATYENIGTVTVPDDTDSDPSHYCNPPEPGIDIEKATNGNDADDANDTDVPEIAPGDPVTWTYVVTNTGDVAYDIADVVVTDDVLGTITNIVDQGDGDDTLAPGEVWTYQATQAAADDLDAPGIGVPVVDGCNPDQVSVPGDRSTYENIGTVTVPDGTDSDPSHYCNPPDPGIDIEKATNGNDADGANDVDVPVIAPGDPVTWTYVVTNTGDVAYDLADVDVDDDIPGVNPLFDPTSDDGGDSVLSPGESWTYTATGTADNLQSPSAGTVVVQGCNPDQTSVPGDRATYENIGTVTVPGDDDSDPSHYCNPPDPGIDIEKATNGNDADGADDADVPVIAPGDPVTWTYVVTNTGDVAFDIADVVVTDDVLGAITNIVDQGDGDDVLAPGEVWTYEATQAAADDLDAPGVSVPVVPGCNPDQTSVPGDRATYENIGTVTVPGDDDSDPSHYCNPPEPGIDIEKATNGNDADGANDVDVPEIAPGDPVTWTYVVTNTGDVAYDLADVVVSDDVLGTITNIVDQGDGDNVLSPGEVWTYQATQAAADDLDAPGIGVPVVDGCNPDQTSVPGDRATYENIGTVTVPDDTDSDPSHYCNPPDPGIDIEKATNGNDADDANDTDVPEIAPGDPVTWTYVVTNTGDVAFDIADVVVTDDVIGAITDIVDQGDGDDVLSPGEVWTYQATQAAADDLDAPGVSVPVVDGCNPDQTNIPGDRATYENIGTVTVPGDTDSDTSHYCNPPEPEIDIEKFTKVLPRVADGDVCGGPDRDQFGKAIRVTMRYNGEGADATDTSQQDSKHEVSGDPNGASPVFIIASEDPDGGGDIFFSGTVLLDGTFVIDGDDGSGQTQFGSATHVTIYASQGGAILQEVEFHTSCSAPLVVGDQFGSLVMEGLEGEDGLVVVLPDPDPTDIGEDADTPTGPQATAGDDIQWTYLVSNPGDVALTDIVVTDDNGTADDDSDDFDPEPVTDNGNNVGDTNDDGFLDPGEVWVYRATGRAILGQYANMSTVVGVPVGGGPEVTDEDPSHYFALFDQDICEAFEKPVKLVMRYTGDGPDATSHSQKSGSVTVDGDPNDASPVLIEVNGEVVGLVDLGDTFDITDLGGDLEVVIKTPGGQVLQEVELHTSCSQPLFIGDQYGALELVDSVDKNGQGPSDPNFTGVFVEKVEYKDDEVKVKLQNTGSTDALISEIEISFPGSNGLLKEVKADSEYKPDPELGSPALITSSDFNDPDKVKVKDDDDLEIQFKFTDKNPDPGAADYTIVIRFADGTVIEV